MPARVIAGFVLLVCIWSLTWAAIKVGIATVPPFVFAIERAIAVSLVLTVVSLALRMRFPRGRRIVVAAALAGIANTGLAWAVIFWSEQYVPSGLVSVFGATSPVWTAVLAHFLVRGDRLTAAKVVALALGLGGTAVLVGAPQGAAGPEALVASVALAVVPVAWALAAILQARLLTRESPLPTVAVGGWAGALVLVPFAAPQAQLPQVWTAATLVSFAYLVVFGSCVGLTLSLWLFRSLRPTTMTFVQVLTPAGALLFGALALGEALTPQMLFGAALVIAAVLVNAAAGAGSTPPGPETPPVAATAG